MERARLEEFAARYALAWSSGDPAMVAQFFAPQGSLAINAARPAAGRAAIAEAARGFMTAFPDLRVAFDRLLFAGDRVEFYWTLEGHHTGPAGTGNYVRISGRESWKFGPEGLIAESEGQFDTDEFERQTGSGRTAS